MECLVLPLHDKLEEWKKMVVNLDKEHSKGSYYNLLFCSSSCQLAAPPLRLYEGVLLYNNSI